MAIPFLNSILGPPLQQRDPWFSVGRSSSYPNITSSQPLCTSLLSTDPSCKIFLIPHPTTPTQTVTQISPSDSSTIAFGGTHDQLLVFQFQGKFHAILNKCPHEAYPLSNGTPFDIEDFGVKLSTGITCAKHGWSFDLFTGRGDRGNSKLGIWELEVRGDVEGEGEVWVRRKPRIG